MDDPVLLRAKFLLSAFQDVEPPTNVDKNAVNNLKSSIVSTDILCGAIKGSSLISTYSDARSIAKRGHYVYIDGNKCQVAEDGDWTSTIVQLAHDFDGATNLNAVITLVPSANKPKKDTKDKKKVTKTLPSPKVPDVTISSDEPYNDILQKANSLLSAFNSSQVDTSSTSTLVTNTKPSKLQVKKQIDDLLSKLDTSEESEPNHDTSNHPTHSSSISSVSRTSNNASIQHTKSLRRKSVKPTAASTALTTLFEESSIASSLDNDGNHDESAHYSTLNNTSKTNNSNGSNYLAPSSSSTASSSSLEYDYSDYSSHSRTNLSYNGHPSPNNSSTTTTTTTSSSSDMKRQAILNRLAMKMKQDKQLESERVKAEEQKKLEIKLKNDEKSKQFQELTNERVAKKLKVRSMTILYCCALAF